MEIFRSGEGRVQVRGVPRDGGAVGALLAWLGGRGEVARVQRREQFGAVEVHYRESGAPGAFLRSLEEYVFRLDAPVGPSGLGFELTHTLPGRARIRMPGASDDEVVRVAAFLAGLEGVARASASPAASSVLVVFDPAVTSDRALLSALEASERSSWPEAPPPAPSKGVGWAMTAASAAVFAATMTEALPPLAIGAAVAATAVPSLKRAAVAMRQRRVTVDLLDLGAVGISLATGQPHTAAFITLLLSVGDRILDHTADSARGAISRLMRLEATEAFKVEGERVEKVPASRLRVGDRIVVGAGGRVAADGLVVRGEASVDEKALTGESVPRPRGVGERILAATVVVEGQVVVEVERTGVDTTAAKIVQILEGAGAKPMTLQRDVERVTDRLVLPTFGVGGAAALVTGQMARMTAVLITDFGTGVRIAVPTAALSAMAMAAREGVLVKGAQYLERLAKADTIVFDKTGTLTQGCPEVLEVVPAGSTSEAELLSLAAGAEARQAHPIAEAIRRHAEARGAPRLEPSLGSETVAVGLGVGAEVAGRRVLVGGSRWMARHGVDTSHVSELISSLRRKSAAPVLVSADGELVGVLGLCDAPRPESAEVVRKLRDGGRRTIVLLSGDTRECVEHVARVVGADRAIAEVLPEEKARVVKELQREGRVVAMVGDGINDAPALALADVGISLHGGTEVALETADVVLLEGGLSKLPDAFEAGDRALSTVHRALGMVIVPNAVGIVAGALGLVNPALAALINNGSTVAAALYAASPLVRGLARRS